MDIILASGSPRRKELLHQIGLEFKVITSDIEEVVTSTNPGDVVCELSKEKALDVFKNTDGIVCVIGADTVVAIDNKILGKPKDKSDAKNMLKLISGRAHSVFTGVTVCVRYEDGREDVSTFAEETKVNVRNLSDDDIMEYIATGEPMDKAGSYGIQGRFGAYVSGIEGDYNNVVGLPISSLHAKLKEMGVI